MEVGKTYNFDIASPVLNAFVMYSVWLKRSKLCYFVPAAIGVGTAIHAYRFYKPVPALSFAQTCAFGSAVLAIPGTRLGWVITCLILNNTRDPFTVTEVIKNQEQELPPPTEDGP